jgi:hypothetical protein
LITRRRGKRARRGFDARNCGHNGHHVTSRLAERS